MINEIKEFVRSLKCLCSCSCDSDSGVIDMTALIETHDNCTNIQGEPVRVCVRGCLCCGLCFLLGCKLRSNVGVKIQTHDIKQRVRGKIRTWTLQTSSRGPMLREKSSQMYQWRLEEDNSTNIHRSEFKRVEVLHSLFSYQKLKL